MALNEAGITVERPVKAKKAEAVVPHDLAAALSKNKKAQAAFDKFSPSHRREYIEWITEARTGATKRTRQALEWLAEGKPRTGSTCSYTSKVASATRTAFPPTRTRVISPFRFSIEIWIRLGRFIATP
jgi:hypothetical protein